jgi:hypothetical protein
MQVDFSPFYPLLIEGNLTPLMHNIPGIPIYRLKQDNPNTREYEL